MGVKTRTNKRVGLAISFQAMMNHVITPDNDISFTGDDYIVIDFLSRTSSPTEDFLKKIANQVCCWDVEFQIATTPSKYVDQAYLDYIKNTDFKHWSEVNCDINELFYHHEGTSTFDTIHIVASKIFQEFVDPSTHLLEAQVKIIPMNLSDRIKKYGPFKTIVGITDELNIHYYYHLDNHLKNMAFLDRPYTNI